MKQLVFRSYSRRRKKFTAGILQYKKQNLLSDRLLALTSEDKFLTVPKKMGKLLVLHEQPAVPEKA